MTREDEGTFSRRRGRNICTLINSHVLMMSCDSSHLPARLAGCLSYHSVYGEPQQFNTDKSRGTRSFPCNNSDAVCPVTQRVTVYTLPVLLEALCKRAITWSECPSLLLSSPCVVASSSSGQKWPQFQWIYK